MPTLDPIVYEEITDAFGVRVGWRVPQSERVEWDRREGLVGQWSAEIRETRARLSAWDDDHSRADEVRNTCAGCGKPLEREQRMYCSRSCSSRAHARRSQDETFPF